MRFILYVQYVYCTAQYDQYDQLQIVKFINIFVILITEDITFWDFRCGLPLPTDANYLGV